MKNLKNYLKLWPLSPRFKAVMILGSLFMILGIGLDITQFIILPDKGKGSPLTVFSVFYMLAGSFIMQCSMLLGMSQMVLTSPKKRRIFFTYPVVFTVLMNLSMYGIAVVIRVIGIQKTPELTSVMGYTLLFAGGFTLLIGIMNGLTYKYYWASFIPFLITWAFGYSLLGNPMELEHNQMGTRVLEVIGNWSFTERAWIGFAMCLVGNVLFIFFTRLVYRAPISQHIFRSMARKSV